MRFTKITISNYRSIRELSLDLSEIGGCFCRILAGINESGKSNILGAIALLSKGAKSNYLADVNKKAEGEPIQICCDLSEEAASELEKYMLGQQGEGGMPADIRIKQIRFRVLIDKDSKRCDEFLVSLDSVPKGKYSHNKKGLFSAIEGGNGFGDKASPPPDTTVDQGDADQSDTEGNDSGQQPNDSSVRALETIGDWESVLSEHHARKVLSGLLPKVIFWRYDSKHLIDGPIDLGDFANDVAISKPLYNVFRLAGHEDPEAVSGVINRALGNTTKMGELRDSLTRATQKYINGAWPKHGIRVEVHTDKPNIEFHIKEDFDESGRYNVGQRSDGFKHFLAILLNLAAENSSEELRNALILLDEPEIHLHPSGARYLRDELLGVARNNALIYSTHSIFMIDTKCLDRHYKVQKDKEDTGVIAIDSDNPFREELIYEALGTSVFSLIREHNLLVEGPIDKKLIEAFSTKFRTELKPPDVNVIPVGGAPHFEKYLNFFDGKSLKGYVLCDSDTSGKATKKNIIKNHSCYDADNTFELDDLIDNKTGGSVEDLLPPEILEECISKCCNLEVKISGRALKLVIDEHNKRDGITKPINHDELKRYICNFVCNDVLARKSSKAFIKEKYGTFHGLISKLYTKIKSTK